MKIAIIYHSESGNTKKIADIIKSEAEGAAGIEAKAISLADMGDADKRFIGDSRAVIFGCPTYAGTMSWQMKKYLDTVDVPLAGKLGSAFATENHLGGGADFAELSIIGCLLVRGMVVYTGGAAEAPFTHFGAVAIKGGDDAQVDRAKKFALKIVKKAKELFSE